VREVVVEYPAAREVAERVDAGNDVDPGDVGAAIGGLRSVFDYVVAEFEPP
jgi:hypothetical protein